MSAPLQAPQQGHDRREFIKHCCRFRAEWATNAGYTPCLSFYATYNLMPVTRPRSVYYVCVSLWHTVGLYRTARWLPV